MKWQLLLAFYLYCQHGIFHISYAISILQITITFIANTERFAVCRCIVSIHVSYLECNLNNVYIVALKIELKHCIFIPRRAATAPLPLACLLDYANLLSIRVLPWGLFATGLGWNYTSPETMERLDWREKRASARHVQMDFRGIAWWCFLSLPPSPLGT